MPCARELRIALKNTVSRVSLYRDASEPRSALDYDSA